MIVCPSCRNEELVGALYCTECGADLYQLEVSPPTTVLYNSTNLRTSGEQQQQPENQPATPATSLPQAVVFLKIMKTGQTIPLEGGDEFTIGRISGNQPIHPDIDLTPYKAYEGGVSRLHATIKVYEDKVTITDLGSANGTRLNNNKIPAHQPSQIKNEDILAFGKLKTQVLIQRY